MVVVSTNAAGGGLSSSRHLLGAPGPAAGDKNNITSSPRGAAEHMNLLKSDPELRSVLELLETVETRSAYLQLRASFLKRFETLVAERTSSGNEPQDNSSVKLAASSAPSAASAAHSRFADQVRKTEKKACLLKELTQSGGITKTTLSVKAKATLTGFNAGLATLGADIHILLPTSSAAEAKSGYTKYHLLIELIKTQFSVYGEMKEIKEIAHFVKENMDETQGKQLLNEVEHFDRMVDRFAGVMADLGLWTFMLKAREFDTSGADLIFLDPLTGAVGEISRKFLHDSKGNKLDLVAPARVDDPEAKKLLIDTITTVLRQLTGEDQTDSQQET